MRVISIFVGLKGEEKKITVCCDFGESGARRDLENITVREYVEGRFDGETFGYRYCRCSRFVRCL